MRQETINIYSFNELSEAAKKVALQNLCDINVIDNWWYQVYEDAAEAGIKITGFDTDRGNYCQGDLTKSGMEVCEYIIQNHGEGCDTYKTAMRYYDNLKIWKAQEDREAIENAEYELRNELLIDYLKLLREDYEYKFTEEAVIETIEANEYEFLESGKQYTI